MKQFRKYLRMTDHDYSIGSYFITICVNSKLNLLGSIVEAKVVLNSLGNIVKKCWEDLARRYGYVSLDNFIIMPNHFHGIITIQGDYKIEDAPEVTGRDLSLLQPVSTKIKPLPELIGVFKTTSSKQIHLLGHKNFSWQRSYYDRCIRNEDEFITIKKYILENPFYWEIDKYNPNNSGKFDIKKYSRLYEQIYD